MTASSDDRWQTRRNLLIASAYPAPYPDADAEIRAHLAAERFPAEAAVGVAAVIANMASVELLLASDEHGRRFLQTLKAFADHLLDAIGDDE